MPRKIKKITPWARWCLIVTIVSPDRRTAERRLGLSKMMLSMHLNQIMSLLGVTTLMHAALKLGLLKVNYEELGEWFTERNVNIAPGIDLDLEGDQ
jgi:hypothetical protein